MELFDYLIAWFVYMLAALTLTVVAWRVLCRFINRNLAYLLQGFLVAVLFTPWYVLPDAELMAPAFIIFVLDSITISPVDGIRALIPIVMAMLAATVVALALMLIRFIRRRKERA